MLKFEHTFVEEPRYGQVSDDLDETPANARIEFSIGDEGIWLAANPEGYLYLARLFAELGTRKFEDGYHFHRPEWLKNPANPKHEVSVEVVSGDWISDAQS